MFSYKTHIDTDCWISFKHLGGGIIKIRRTKIEGFTDTSVFTSSGHAFIDLVDVDKTMNTVDKQMEEYLNKTK